MVGCSEIWLLQKAMGNAKVEARSTLYVENKNQRTIAVAEALSLRFRHVTDVAIQRPNTRSHLTHSELDDVLS